MSDRGESCDTGGIGHPAARASSLVLDDDDAATRPNGPRKASEHLRLPGIGDEVQRVGEQGAVEHRELQPLRKVGVDRGNGCHATRAPRGHAPELIQGVPIALHGDDATVGSEQSSESECESARPGAEVGPGTAGMGDGGLNERRRVANVHARRYRATQAARRAMPFLTGRPGAFICNQ